jgi:lysophospholipase
MNDIKLLGEDDFYDVMKGTVQPWIKSTVKSGYFESYDFTEIHYYYAIPENPRGIIVMVHGFCEFFGKYHEMAWYFYQLGYALFLPGAERSRQIRRQAPRKGSRICKAL